MCFFREVCVYGESLTSFENVSQPSVTPAGEKMTEKEIEVVMEGQEDSNGCINYQGDYFMQCAEEAYWFPPIVNTFSVSISLFQPL